jgi:hypothetical protein
MRIPSTLILVFLFYPAAAIDPELLSLVNSRWGPADGRQVTALIEQAEREGYAVRPLENKVFEGIAKSMPPGHVIAAVQRRIDDLRVIVAGKKSNRTDQERALYAHEKARGIPDTAGRKPPPPSSSMLPAAGRSPEIPPIGHTEKPPDGAGRSDEAHRRNDERKTGMQAEKIERIQERLERKTGKIESRLEKKAGKPAGRD